MARSFSPATAEQVVVAVEAVVANGGAAATPFVAEFADLKAEQASAALMLGVDLGLLKEARGQFALANPISRFLRSPQDNEKAAVLRIVLEAYEPFQVFREELEASGDASSAAVRTKTRLALDAHREDIKSTLVNLATYSGALRAGNGGQYERDSKSASSLLKELAAGATEEGAAIHQVRTGLGTAANAVSHEQVLVPLAAALRHAAGGAAREAVVHAGNSIDTFLDEFATRRQISLTGATGINGKIDKLQSGGALPKKLAFNAKYLGHIRNAADHGVDADVGSSWSIQASTGLNYVFVAISFIRAVSVLETGQFEI
jgi:hypothetical protein